MYGTPLVCLFYSVFYLYGAAACQLFIKRILLCYVMLCSGSYWSNPPFLISDIRALWRSVLSARVPECQKLKTVG